MSTSGRARQKFTRDEIIEILKRNMPVYRDDETFVQYIVDLATYLVEYRINLNEEMQRIQAASTESQDSRRRSLSKTYKRDVELLGVLSKHASKPDEKSTCRMCGAPTGGRLVCFHCGSMTF